MKKVISLLVIMAFLLTVVPTTTAQAAVKLNKTSLTLDEGSSYRLSISGTTKTVKWSSSNKKVATVSSRGTVKAIKAGTATITATVAKKSYKCKVKVKDVLTNEEAAANITYKATECAKNIVVVLKNKNKVNLWLTAEITYYDSNNAVIATDKDYIGTFEAGKEAVVHFYYPYDSNYDYITYDHFKLKITTELKYVSSDKVVDEISVESNSGASGLVLTAKNNSDEDISSAKVGVLYYKNDKIVAYDFAYFTNLAPGESSSQQLYTPYDRDFKDIEYDDYKVIVCEASFKIY